MSPRVLLATLALAACGERPAPCVPEARAALGPDETRVPAETASAAALARVADYDALPRFTSGLYRTASSEDRNTGEPPPLPLLDHGNRDMNNFVCAGKDAAFEDPVLIEPVLDLARCPEDYVEGFVLARFEGTGSLVRLWLTTLELREGLPDAEVLRIYVDGDPSPLVQVPLAAALDGSAGEIFAPPFGAGVHTHLAWRYPVAFAERLIVSLDRLGPLELVFHHTTVVLDDALGPDACEPVRLPERDAAADALATRTEGSAGVEERLTLDAGQARELRLAGPATLKTLTVLVSADELAALRLTAHWDDQTAAAFDLPLARLFSAGLDPPSTASHALSGAVDAGEVVLTLGLPMPFATSARLTVTNDGTRPVSLRLRHTADPGVPEGEWGHLHALARATGPDGPVFHPVVNVEGRGRYVGACLAVQGHAMSTGFDGYGLNVLEGDPVAVVDDTRVVLAPGTEDYFDNAFYFESGPFETPFAQAWGIVEDDGGTPPGGRVSTCRWHLGPDAVDFSERFALELEVGPGRPDLADRLETVAFWYAR